MERKMKDIIARINELRTQKNALILAHNYQPIQIQELADYRGDSLQLAMLSAQLDNPLIVFCGVRFMAETAAILNPKTKVLLPVQDAGCPMADMITGLQLREFKRSHPGSTVVCYVNSTVEVKAESDICCTSSNAVKVIQSVPKDHTVLFVPDRNLGSWAAKQTGRKVITWDGYCPIHQWGFTTEDVANMRAKYPEHKLLAHPECDPEIVDQADEVMSTGGMMNYAKTHDKMIIATETGLTNYLQHIYPEKSIVTLSPKAICPDMKKISLEDVLAALEQEQYHIQVPEDIATKAKVSIDRMLELS
ncbi:MAG: quinolinate synthase NadA [Candidatus Cloacimonetes bacterium]|nr:quinolinate synthase NadA [Candidatus Cloacimonadota bacterium]